ncbi:MAG: SHOCT domain-containing protein [Bacteroidota bacterium]
MKKILLSTLSLLLSTTVIVRAQSAEQSVINNLLTNLQSNPDNPLKVDKQLLENVAKAIPDGGLKNKLLAYSANIGVDGNLSMRQVYWDLGTALAKNSNLSSIAQFGATTKGLNVLMNNPEELVSSIKNNIANYKPGAFANDPVFMSALTDVTGSAQWAQNAAIGVDLVMGAIADAKAKKKFNEDYKKLAEMSSFMIYPETDRGLSRSLIDAAVLYRPFNTVTPLYKYDFDNGASLFVEIGILKFQNPSKGIKKNLTVIPDRNNGVDNTANNSPVLLKIADDESRFYISSSDIKVPAGSNCLDTKEAYVIDANTGEAIKLKSAALYAMNFVDIRSAVFQNKIIFNPLYNSSVTNLVAYKHDFSANPKNGVEQYPIPGSVNFYLKDRERGLTSVVADASHVAAPIQTYCYPINGGLLTLFWGYGESNKIIQLDAEDRTKYSSTILYAGTTEKQRANTGLVNSLTGIAMNKKGDLFFINKLGAAGKISAAEVNAGEALYNKINQANKTMVAKPYNFLPTIKYLFNAVAFDLYSLPTFHITPDDKWLTYILEDELYLISTEDMTKVKTFKFTNKPYDHFFSKENGEPVLYISAFNEFKFPITKKYSLAKLIEYEPAPIVPIVAVPALVKEVKATAGKSITDEIKELKKMLDDGTITKEQFEKAKNKLLGEN